MALPKLFQRIFFHNNTTPSINEDNFNAVSKGLSDVDDRVISLAGTIMEDVPQIQEDIEELEADMALIDTKIASATTEANRATTAANNAAASVISAGNKALVSEGWAKGTQNGVPVGSTSPYHNNNAEYFKNQARSFTPQGYQDLVDDVDSLKETLTNFEESITGEVVDSEPYVLRQGLGNLADMSLVGGSIAWNQLIRNGNFASTSGILYDRGTLSASNNVLSYTVTVVGTFTGSNWIGAGCKLTTNHKYLQIIDINIPKATEVRLGLWSSSGSNLDLKIFNTITTTNSWVNLAAIIPYTKDGGSACRVNVGVDGSKFAINDVIKFKNFMLFDLTQLFGSTIADYIYSLEQATAGAGVAWFRQYFPNAYYSYQSGKIESVNVASRKVVGFNLWDEEWEMGLISSTTGQDVYSTQNIRSKNYISCLPNHTYYCRRETTVAASNFAIAFYDADKKFINTVYKTSDTFDAPATAYYMRFDMNVGYGRTYNNDICINISKTTGSPKNGDYVPYSGTEYPFDTSIQLRGIPKLVDNKLSYDGDVYTADGTVTRKYGIVDLGTLIWHRNSFGNTYRFSANLAMGNYGTGALFDDVLCSKYVTNDSVLRSNQIDKVICGYGSQNAALDVYLRDDSYTDANALKTSLNGVYLVWKLATPTTETVKPYQNPQRAFIDGTEEFVDAGVQSATRDVSIPVGNNTTYQLNETLPPTEDYVDGALKFKAAISALGTDESGRTTASRAYTTGEFFYKDGKMYKVLTSIAQGATFTINTNCQQTTLFAELKALAQ